MNTQLVVEPEQKPDTAGQGSTTATASNVLAFARVGPRPMFSQTFVEQSEADRKRKRATQSGSFIVQLMIVGFLFLIPLWFVDVLPVQSLATFLVAPPPPPPPPPPAAPTVKVERVSEVVNGSLRSPSKIPEKVKMIKEEEAPPPTSGGVIGGVEGGVPGGQVNGVLGSILTSNHTGPTVVAAPPKRIRVSTGISEGMLIHRVEPVYPTIAARARIQGTVQLRAVIAKDGSIENLQVIGGHPILQQAALDAVKQWRYKPYILNGEPLEVETIVIVNFHMS
ncbi:MAG TPA: TonB family protein [Candidatus Angelobacter sp.]|nr:TonB family protein [Candidatus Angelobacter sp.]